jgi:hypothetical protein
MASRKIYKTFSNLTIDPEFLEIESYYDSKSEEDFIDEMDFENKQVSAALHFRKQHHVIKAKVNFTSHIHPEDEVADTIENEYISLKVEYKINSTNWNIPNIEIRIKTLLVEYFLKNPKKKLMLFEGTTQRHQKCFGCGFSGFENNFFASPAGNRFIKCPNCQTHFERTDD